MNLQTDLYAAVAGLLVCTVFILWWTMRSRNPGVGLLLGYWLQFLQNYGIAGVMHTLPWVNSPFAEETAVGFPEAVLSLVAFCFGAGLTQVVMRRSHSLAGSTASDVAIRWATPKQIFVLGIVVGYLLAPLINRIPSGSAVSSTLASLTVAAWGLWVFQAVRKQSPASVALLLVGTMVFPLSTVIGSGFLGGVGVNSVAAIVGLAVVYHRPRVLSLAVGCVVLYVGMSVYVSYMRDRKDIRDSVWGGESLGARVGVVVDTLSRLEWFDAHEEAHLQRIDERMNQNSLFGAAIKRLERGEVDYWRGESLLGAALAAIPRFLWPDKPMVVGSGDLVSELTGIVFESNTSVGIGPVMEFYANFGRFGMLIASVAMGAFLGFCDLRAGAALRAGHTTRFTAWALMGLPMLNVLGSLVAVSSSLATAIVIFVLFRRFWERRETRSTMPTQAIVEGMIGSERLEEKPASLSSP
jgi:hypothetical protein